MVMVKAVKNPNSPPFGGTEDGEVKVIDASMGENTIILFPLAMV